MQINKFNYIFEKLDQSFILILSYSLRGDNTTLYHSMLHCNGGGGVRNNKQSFYFLYNTNYVSPSPNETG